MAVNLIYKVKIDTKDAVGNIKEIDASYVDTLDTLEKLERAQLDLNDAIKGVTKGSAEYKQLESQLRQVNTELKNADLNMEALDNEQLGTSIKSVAGGLTDIAGGLALIGVSGDGIEKIAETFAQVEGLSKVVGGAFDIWNDGLKLVKQAQNAAAVSSSALTAAQVTQGVATKGAAIQQGILNTVMNANPVLLLVTGIGLLVGAFAAFSSASDEVNEAEKKRIDTEKKGDEQRKEYSKSLAKEIVGIKVLSAQIKESEPGSKRRSDLIKEMNSKYGTHLKNIKDEASFTKALNDQVRDYIKLAESRIRATLAEEGATKQIARENELRAKANKLRKEAGDIDGFAIKNAQGLYELNKENEQISIARLSTEEQNRALSERDDQRKKVEQVNEANRLLGLADLAGKYGDAYLESAAKYSEASASTTETVTNNTKEQKSINKQLEESVNDLIEAEYERTHSEEENALRRKELKDQELKDQWELSTDLLNRDSQLKEGLKLNEINYQNEINNIREKANDEARKNEINNRNDELAELQAGFDDIEKLNNSARVNEENSVKDKYFRLIELAKKNGEDEKVFVDAQEKELLAIKEKYDQEDIDNEEAAQAKRIQMYQETSQIIKDLYGDIGSSFNAIASGDLFAINNAFIELNNTVNMFTEDALKRLQEGFDGLTDEEKVQAIATTIMEITSITTSAIDAMNQARFDKEQDLREQSYNSEVELFTNQLAERIISQDEYDMKMRMLDEAKKRADDSAKQKAFKQQKKLAMINAAMSTAAAVVMALATMAPPVSYVLAGVNAALGAAQIAIISKQEYRAARGGIVPGNGSPAFDSVPALLAPGETVINSNSSSMFPGLLSEINKAGGGVELSPSGGIGISNNDNDTVFRQDNVIEALVSSDKITKKQSDVDRARRNSRFE